MGKVNKDLASDILVKLIFIIPVLLLVGLAIYVGIASINKQDEPQSAEQTKPQSKTITVEQAEAYVGKTLGELCSQYGDYKNLKPFSIKAGGTIMCGEQFSKNFYNFIVVQAYTNEAEEHKAKQKACKDDDYSFCDEPLTVYVDVLPEDEARGAGVIVK